MLESLQREKDMEARLREVHEKLAEAEGGRVEALLKVDDLTVELHSLQRELKEKHDEMLSQRIAEETHMAEISENAAEAVRLLEGEVAMLKHENTALSAKLSTEQGAEEEHDAGGPKDLSPTSAPDVIQQITGGADSMVEDDKQNGTQGIDGLDDETVRERLRIAEAANRKLKQELERVASRAGPHMDHSERDALVPRYAMKRDHNSGVTNPKTMEEALMVIKELRCSKTMLEFRLRKAERLLQAVQEEHLAQQFSAPTQITSKELTTSSFRGNHEDDDDDGEHPTEQDGGSSKKKHRCRHRRGATVAAEPAPWWGLFSALGAP